MNNLAGLLRQQGKLAEAGRRSLGLEVTFLEEVFQGHIFCVAKA